MNAHLHHPPAKWPALGRWASLSLALALAACGGGGGGGGSTPPPAGGSTTYTVGVTVNAVGSGESFAFAMGGQNIAVTQGAVSVKFAQALASGASYTVSQTAGPRTCTLSANRTGTIASANVEITAACGSVPGAGTPLTGTLRGPVGAQVVLQNNGGAGLGVTVLQSPGVIDAYDETAFTFTTPLADGTAYALALASNSANQTCSVYKGATGTMPVAAGAVRVGCEITYDHLSRNTSSSVRGTYYDSRDPVTGGSNDPLGATGVGYGEGRFVAFVSTANLAAGAVSGRRQIYWRDKLTGETLLVSATAAGVEGNGDSWAPAISADGLVVFESSASNLVGNDTNGVSDVFGWSALDPQGGVDRLSVGPGGVEANSASYRPSVSGDGRVVAFVSGASNLTPGVSGISTLNVYRRDVVAGTNTLISASTSGVGVGGEYPALSEDGNRLAFYSFASNIVSGDNNGLWDIFVYDHAAGSRTRVSFTATGGERNQGSESASRVVAPAISGNGRYVGFATTATNMLGAATNGAQHVYVVDTQTGALTRGSVSSAGVVGNADSPLTQGERVALSYDGTWVAFSTASNNLGAGAGTSGISNAVMHNRVTGETRAVTDMSTSSVGPVAMSRNAAYVVFGAGNPLDSRFTSTGLFARFTGLQRSWWWID